MKPWSHLPNAHLIDWVLESLKTDPDSWNTARDAAWNAAEDAVVGAAWDAAWDAARDAARNAARDAAWDAARDAAWDAARDAAQNLLAALIAYDDCQQYLDMTYEQLKIYALLSEKPQAVLLLPLKWVQENENLVTPA